MKLTSNIEISIKKEVGEYFVRISIGDYMYFDSPTLSLKTCRDVLRNLKQ